MATTMAFRARPYANELDQELAPTESECLASYSKWPLGV